MSVSPLLYLLAFGLGMGKGVSIDGRPYLEFLVPGLVAMSSMTQAFAIAGEINIARFYWRIFEEFQAAPIRDIAYVTGEVLAGITRALIAVGIILLIGFAAGVRLACPPLFWIAVVLNAFLFSSLAVCLAMLVKSHSDQALLTNFFITPMAFLGGTFFPVNHAPLWARRALESLPLTHAAKAIRGAAMERPPEVLSYALLAAVGTVLFVLAFLCVNRARD